MDELVVERPAMPPDYGPDDDVGGLLPWAWAEQRLQAARNYWIATVGPTGLPHLAPVWGAWVHGAVWFGTDPTSAKGRNLARDDRLAVHLESGEEAVIAYGRAERWSLAALEPGLLDVLDAAYAAKYVDPESGQPFRLSAAPAGSLVYRVRPRRVLGWVEHDFLRTRTRWQLPA